MNTEILKALLTEIRRCSVKVNGNGFCDVCCGDVVGNPDNVVLNTQWVDSESMVIYHISFTEGNFATAMIDGNTINLDNSEGLPTFIMLFDIVPHPIITNWN